MAAEPDHDPEQAWHLTVTTQDLDELAARLTTWLGTKVDHEGPVKVANLTRPQAGGMSSSTILFDASWETNGRPDGGSYVARMAPDPQSFPAFETYDLARQFAIMRAVAANSDVPVPELCWLEEDGSVLGAPFFVMRRVDGRIPEDNPPYVFVGWLHDATPEQRMTLIRNTIEIIAKIHAIPDPVANFPMLATPGGSRVARARGRARAWYRWARADDGYPIPLLDRAFDWLEQHWPADPGRDVLSWGDSRIGNIIYAVSSRSRCWTGRWPRSARARSISRWLIFIHRFFQDIAEMLRAARPAGLLPARGRRGALRARSPVIACGTSTSTSSTRRCGTRS